MMNNQSCMITPHIFPLNLVHFVFKLSNAFGCSPTDHSPNNLLLGLAKGYKQNMLHGPYLPVTSSSSSFTTYSE